MNGQQSLRLGIVWLQTPTLVMSVYWINQCPFSLPTAWHVYEVLDQTNPSMFSSAMSSESRDNYVYGVRHHYPCTY